MKKIWLDLKIMKIKSKTNKTYTFNYWNPLTYLLIILLPITVGITSFFIGFYEGFSEIKRWIR